MAPLRASFHRRGDSERDVGGPEPLLLQPLEGRLGDLLPAVVDDQGVAPVLEDLVVVHRRGLAVQVVLRAGDGLRDRRVPARADDEQGTPVRVADVDPRARLPVEVGEGRLEQRAGRRRNRILRVQLVGLLLRDRVREALVELLGRLGHGALVVGRVAEHRKGGPELGEGQRQHAPHLRGADGHRRRREPHAEQLLRDHPPERVPDDDRLRVERAQEPGVMLGDFDDAPVGDALRVRAALLDGARVPGPARVERLVPGLAEEVGPGLPGVGVHPESVDEDHG